MVNPRWSKSKRSEVVNKNLCKLSKCKVERLCLDIESVKSLSKEGMERSLDQYAKAIWSFFFRQQSYINNIVLWLDFVCQNKTKYKASNNTMWTCLWHNDAYTNEQMRQLLPEVGQYLLRIFRFSMQRNNLNWLERILSVYRLPTSWWLGSKYSTWHADHNTIRGPCPNHYSSRVYEWYIFNK